MRSRGRHWGQAAQVSPESPRQALGGPRSWRHGPASRGCAGTGTGTLQSRSRGQDGLTIHPGETWQAGGPQLPADTFLLYVRKLRFQMRYLVKVCNTTSKASSEGASNIPGSGAAPSAELLWTPVGTHAHCRVPSASTGLPVAEVCPGGQRPPGVGSKGGAWRVHVCVRVCTPELPTPPAACRTDQEGRGDLVPKCSDPGLLTGCARSGPTHCLPRRDPDMLMRTGVHATGRQPLPARRRPARGQRRCCSPTALGARPRLWALEGDGDQRG